MRNFILALLAFLSGAAVIALEITGARVLAPYAGTSLVVWTSLIGVILASLSLGYYWGGRGADKNPSYHTLSLLLLGSGLYIGAVALTKDYFLTGLQTALTDIRLNATVSALFLFALPSLLLGAVSPYLAKLNITALADSGKAVGNLYALSTLGSIVGTFLTGLVLLAYIGNTNILIGLAALLLLLSLAADYKKLLKTKIILLILTTASLGLAPLLKFNPALIDIDTPYNRVWIYDSPDSAAHRTRRVLFTDPLSAQSAAFLDSNELVFAYTKYYQLAEHFKPGFKRVLMVGGAAYSVPKYFLEHYPAATIDVVEIDPGMTRIARQYFNLKDNTRLAIYHEDGRAFLNRLSRQNPAERYDVILLDAFKSLNIPHQLATAEAVAKIFSLLQGDGVVISNIASAITGDKGQFLRAEYATFADIFPQTMIFPVQYPQESDRLQNVMLVALKTAAAPKMTSDNPELTGYLSHRFLEPIAADRPVLTDDFAPVERYISRLAENGR